MVQINFSDVFGVKNVNKSCPNTELPKNHITLSPDAQLKLVKCINCVKLLKTDSTQQINSNDAAWDHRCPVDLSVVDNFLLKLQSINNSSASRSVLENLDISSKSNFITSLSVSAEAKLIQLSFAYTNIASLVAKINSHIVACIDIVAVHRVEICE